MNPVKLYPPAMEYRNGLDNQLAVQQTASIENEGLKV